MSYLEALDRPIAYHRVFVSLAGSVAGAVFLSQLVYWARRMDREFYKSVDDWSEETGLTRYEQESARKKLKALGVLKVKRKGVPARLFYSLDFVALDHVISQFAESNKLESDKQQTSQVKTPNKSAESSTQVVDETPNKLSVKPQTITETTQRLPETTQKEGASAPSPSPKKKSPKSPVPDHFEITPALIAWASENEITVDLASCTAQWQDAMRSKDERKVDWVAAWRNAMRFAQKWHNEKIAKQVRQQGGLKSIPIEQALTDRSWATTGAKPNTMQASEGEVLEYTA